jgi:hypothetical protein
LQHREDIEPHQDKFPELATFRDTFRDHCKECIGSTLEKIEKLLSEVRQEPSNNIFLEILYFFPEIEIPKGCPRILRNFLNHISENNVTPEEILKLSYDLKRILVFLERRFEKINFLFDLIKMLDEAIPSHLKNPALSPLDNIYNASQSVLRPDSELLKCIISLETFLKGKGVLNSKTLEYLEESLIKALLERRSINKLVTNLESLLSDEISPRIEIKVLENLYYQLKWYIFSTGPFGVAPFYGGGISGIERDWANPELSPSRIALNVVIHPCSEIGKELTAFWESFDKDELSILCRNNSYNWLGVLINRKLRDDPLSVGEFFFLAEEIPKYLKPME